jgi:hypothetical protein
MQVYMSRKITFLTLFLWLMTVTFPVIAQQKTDTTYTFRFVPIIGKTNRDEIQNQMRLKFARKLQKRNVTEKSHTSYSQKWLSNVN